MTEVLQANIFFLLTGVAVVIFTILLSIALYHLIKILKMVRRITERIESGSETIADDLSAARKYFKEGSFFSHLISIFMGAKNVGFGAKKSSTRKRKSKKKDNEEENE